MLLFLAATSASFVQAALPVHTSFAAGIENVQEKGHTFVKGRVIDSEGNPLVGVTVQIEGHTDRVGSVQSNDAFSIKRAIAVREILVDSGVNPSVIETAGRGEREPLVPTEDEVAEAKNRRVEISVR